MPHIPRPVQDRAHLSPRAGQEPHSNSIHARLALESSSGVALGICPLFVFAADSGKMGRTRSVQFGAIAGAALPLLAQRIPATNVPCMHAALLAREQALGELPLTSRILLMFRSG